MLNSICFVCFGLVVGAVGAVLVVQNNRKHFDAALAKYPALKRSVESAIAEVKDGLK